MGVLDDVVTLRGRLVSLRPISREDYPTLFKWRSSLETVHMLNFRRRIATYEEFVRDFEALLPNAMVMLVQRNKDRTPIGYLIAYNINPWDGYLSVAGAIEPALRLRGHGGEATLRFVDLLFQGLPVRKIMTETFEFAPQDKQMVETLGAEEVGFLADHCWHRGKRWGLHQMALTRENWLRHRERFADVLRIQRSYDELYVREEPTAGNGAHEPVELGGPA